MFEEIEEKTNVFLNFVKCGDTNSSGIKRFTATPLLLHLIRLGQDVDGLLDDIVVSKNRPSKGFNYILSSGVAHSPDNWSGGFKNYSNSKAFSMNQQSVFYWLNPIYLEDLQSGKAFLLLDQSHEGYQETWQWQWFHDQCTEYKIDPKQVIYVTGNMASKEQYDEWATIHVHSSRILVIPYPHFESSMAEIAYRQGVPSFKQQKRYKESNLANIKTFNCLQKRPRNHRAHLFSCLYNADLLNNNINSMNHFAQLYSHMDGKEVGHDLYKKLLPLMPMTPPNAENVEGFADSDCGNYLTNFNEQITLDTWLSVISEAHYSDNTNTCFLSEKTFKTIACNHPFIMFGNRHSLKHLKELGYKTFHPFINEAYDELETWDRLYAIITELKRLNAMNNDEKFELFKGLKSILIHNSNTLLNTRVTVSPAVNLLTNHFKENDVQFSSRRNKR